MRVILGIGKCSQNELKSKKFKNNGIMGGLKGWWRKATDTATCSINSDLHPNPGTNIIELSYFVLPVIKKCTEGMDSWNGLFSPNRGHKQ